MVLKSQEYLSKEYKKGSPLSGVYMQEEIWQTFADWMSERVCWKKGLMVQMLLQTDFYHENE
jgi:hypothetical protein